MKTVFGLTSFSALLVIMAALSGTLPADDPPPEPRPEAPVEALVVDMGADAPRPGEVMVVIGDQVYRGRVAGPWRPRPGPRPPRPGPGPVPPPAPLPDPGPAPAPPSKLGMLAQRYLYFQAVYHHQVAKAIGDEKVPTIGAAGKMGADLRDTAGIPLGAEVNARLKASGSVDAVGRIVNPPAAAAVFEEVAQSYDAVLRPRPAYLGP